MSQTKLQETFMVDVRSASATREAFDWDHAGPVTISLSLQCDSGEPYQTRRLLEVLEECVGTCAITIERIMGRKRIVVSRDQEEHA